MADKKRAWAEKKARLAEAQAERELYSNDSVKSSIFNVVSNKSNLVATVNSHWE